jgi:hypothetical protein
MCDALRRPAPYVSAGGRAVSTEELRYGLRLSVVALPAPPQLTTAKALAVVGPEAFGLGASGQYRPIGTYQEPATIAVPAGPSCRGGASH